MIEIDLSNMLISEMTVGQLLIALTVWALCIGVGIMVAWVISEAYMAQFKVLGKFYDKFGLKQSIYLMALTLGLMIIIPSVYLIWQTPLTLLITVLYLLVPILVPLMIFVLIKGKPETKGMSDV